MSLARYPHILKVLEDLKYPSTDIAVLSNFYEVRQNEEQTIFRMPFHKVNITNYIPEMSNKDAEPLHLDIVVEDNLVHSLHVYYTINGSRSFITVHNSLVYLVDSLKKDDSIEYKMNALYDEFDRIQAHFKLDEYITTTLFERQFSFLYGVDIERRDMPDMKEIAFIVKNYAFKNPWVQLPESLKHFEHTFPVMGIYFDMDFNFKRISFNYALAFTIKSLDLTFDSVCYNEKHYVAGVWTHFKCNPVGLLENEFELMRKFAFCNDKTIRELLPEFYNVGPFNTLESLEERVNVAEMLLFT